MDKNNKIDKDTKPDESFYDLWERIKDSDLSKLPERIDSTIDDKIILSERSEEDIYFMKIVLAGDGAVGKTSLRKSYLGESFSTNYQQTIGADFAIHDDQVASYRVKFVIWDLAGQLMFHQVRKSFYKGAHGALIVCDLTNISTFENLKHWINELWRNNDLGPVPFTIVGNKSDLRNVGFSYIEDDKIHSVAKIINSETLSNYGFGVKSVITSAKTGEGVRQAFKRLAIQILAHQRFIEKISNT